VEELHSGEERRCQLARRVTIVWLDKAVVIPAETKARSWKTRRAAVKNGRRDMLAKAPTASNMEPSVSHHKVINPRELKVWRPGKLAHVCTHGSRLGWQGKAAGVHDQ